MATESINAGRLIDERPKAATTIRMVEESAHVDARFYERVGHFVWVDQE